MPIDMRYDPDTQRLRTTARGSISFADLVAHIDDEARRGHLGAAELFDARDATTDLTALQVRELVDRMREHAARGVLGATALVTHNDVVFGMAQMYSILSDDFDARFFVSRDLASAERWLSQQDSRPYGAA
jgi:hypothetical protein